MAEMVWATLEGKVKRVTEKAIGIEAEESEGGELLWLPKSQLRGTNGTDIPDAGEIELAVGDEVSSVLIPEWLAKEKGLDYSPF